MLRRVARVALAVLRAKLRTVGWHQLTGDILRTPPERLGWAALFTALNYAALTGYDFIAFAYIGRRMDRARIALASFLAYAIANNAGLAMLSGASIRYRFYTRWGVTAEELSRIIFSYSVTFWLGLFALGGLSLALSPLPRAHEMPAYQLVAPAGWLLLLTSVAYVVATALRRQPIRVGRYELPLPSTEIALAQLAMSAVEWALAGAVLYVLLPPSPLTFPGLLGAFLALAGGMLGVLLARVGSPALISFLPTRVSTRVCSCLPRWSCVDGPIIRPGASFRRQPKPNLD